MKLEDLLAILDDKKASDLHLKSGNKPFIRVDGTIQKLENKPVLKNKDIQTLVSEVETDELKKRFKDDKEIDFAITANGHRYRLNVFTEKGQLALVARRLVLDQSTFEELGLPSILEKFSIAPRGLVLVTGVAGSGKTTTISSMIEYINKLKSSNIITIEDPIEFVHDDDKSIIRQREIGADTKTYKQALKHIVRQDPDVIFIGEIRDQETMDSAMKAAELGNLVFSTLHTINATETINRIIDLYPPHNQKQARILLSGALLGIISLRLLPKKGSGRIPAVEILYNTSTVKQYILDPDETSNIKKAIIDGDYYGMQSFNQSLVKLIKDGKIDLDTAKRATDSEQNLHLELKDAGIET